ncbi:MAG: hypothetical protein HWD90_05550 [Campylobacteraceae bacterium]|nr:hypothetical protein [Campylobacteraceae bacterium]
MFNPEFHNKIKVFQKDLSIIEFEIRRLNTKINEIKVEKNNVKDKILKKSYLNNNSLNDSFDKLEKNLKELDIRVYKLNQELETLKISKKNITIEINDLKAPAVKEIIDGVKELLSICISEKIFSETSSAVMIIDSMLYTVATININNVSKYHIANIVSIGNILSQLNISFNNNFSEKTRENLELIHKELTSMISSSIDNSTYTRNEIQSITEQLKELETKNNQLESEKLERERLEKELEIKNKEYTEQIKKENQLREELSKKVEEEKILLEEKEKITNAIKKLKNPAPELKDLKNDYIKEKNNFNLNAERMFMMAGTLFGAIIVYIFTIEGINEFKNADFSFYLAHIFPIIFPTLIGFLFIRQSNIKSNQIENINKRFILIHEVNQSLEALVEVNKGQNMDRKTEKIIDKLINNILDFTIDNKGQNISDKEIEEINTKVDSLINTIKTKFDLNIENSS